MAYFGEKFTPSLTTDFEESELEKIVDYYIDLRKAKHLLQSEVNKLLKEYKSNHDMAAREKVINSSLRDVMYMCLNYQSKHKSIDIQDAIAVGNIGLIEAIEHYDPNARIDFKDYVIYWLARRIDEDFKEEK